MKIETISKIVRYSIWILFGMFMYGVYRLLDFINIPTCIYKLCFIISCVYVPLFIYALYRTFKEVKVDKPKKIICKKIYGVNQ